MSNYGIPEELTYDNLSRLYPSVKQEFRKQPFNGSSFSTGDIQLKLSKISRGFLNPATLALNFRVVHDFSTAGNAVTLNNGAPTELLGIFGNALSYFSNQVVKPVSGQWQDTIAFPGLISNCLLNMSTTPIEKEGMISLGTNNDQPFAGFTNVGDTFGLPAIAINTASSKVYRSYSVPIMGILNCDKMIPMFCDELEIDLTINAQANFVIQMLQNATYKGFVIDNIEIVGDVLVLEEAGFNELLKMYPNGMSIKTESLLYGSSSLPAQAKGVYDVTYSHGLNSLKKFIWWASPAGNWEGNYGGVNPNMQNYQLYIGSTTYPQLPVKSTSVAENFYQIQKSFGAFYSTSHCGSLARDNFSKCSLVSAGSQITAEYVNYIHIKPASFNSFSNANSIHNSANSNKFYQALDVEQINQLKNTMYSGISTKGSTNLLRINVGETLANHIHNITYYSVYDAVVTFDWVNSTISQST